MDDIVIYSNSVEEHKRHVALILHYCFCSKSTLFADCIEFLGHIISRGLQATPEKLDKIAKFSTPSHAADIKSFLGLVSSTNLAQFDYIPGLADYSSCILTCLTRKGVPFTVHG
jgi:hypothetical protein